MALPAMQQAALQQLAYQRMMQQQYQQQTTRPAANDGRSREPMAAARAERSRFNRRVSKDRQNERARSGDACETGSTKARNLASRAQSQPGTQLASNSEEA